MEYEFDISNYQCLEASYPLLLESCDDTMEMSTEEMTPQPSSTQVSPYDILLHNQHLWMAYLYHTQMLQSQYTEFIQSLPPEPTPVVNKKEETYKIPERTPKWNCIYGLECNHLPDQLPKKIKDIYLHLKENIKIEQQLNRYFKVRHLRVDADLDTTMYSNLSVKNLQCKNYTLYSDDQLESIVADELNLMAITGKLIYARVTNIRCNIDITNTSIRFLDAKAISKDKGKIELVRRKYNVEYLTLREVKDVTIEYVPFRVKHLRLISRNPELVVIRPKVWAQCHVHLYKSSDRARCEYDYPFWNDPY